jgi:hypothetical protein
MWPLSLQGNIMSLFKDKVQKRIVGYKNKQQEREENLVMKTLIIYRVHQLLLE